ncbi:MAG: DUF1405 domain-containing protein [Bacillota bacterium]
MKKIKNIRAFLIELLLLNPFRRWFLVTLAIINLAGSVYGYYWYSPQLAVTPWWWWPLVTDSPLSTTLMAVVVGAFWAGRPLPFLPLVAYTTVIKYGVWASVIILDYWFQGGEQDFILWMLFLSHLGMALQGYLFWRHLKATWKEGLAAVLWMGLNDLVDYAGGLHPNLYTPQQLPLAAVTGISLTILLTVTIWQSCKNGPDMMVSRGE